LGKENSAENAENHAIFAKLQERLKRQKAYKSQFFITYSEKNQQEKKGAKESSKYFCAPYIL
jgi:hypothetical protein